MSRTDTASCPKNSKPPHSLPDRKAVDVLRAMARFGTFRSDRSRAAADQDRPFACAPSSRGVRHLPLVAGGPPTRLYHSREAIVIRASFGKIVGAAIGISLSPACPDQGAAARTDEIKVLSANVFAGVLDELASGFELASEHKVTIIYKTAGTIEDRIRAGEFADVVILPRQMTDELVRQGKIIHGSSVNLADSTVGVAARAGAPKPDIGSVDALKRSLLAVTSISYPDPTSGAATGVLFSRVLNRLGISEDVKTKTKFPPPGHIPVDVVARGEAEIAISQPMEVLAQPGVELVGLLPSELQDRPHFTFSVSIPVAAKEPQAAEALIRFLSGPAAAVVLKAKGMEPG
jgi:molybdate transport system substrate-binding protein